VCVCAFSLHRESPDMILGEKPLISEVVLSPNSSRAPTKGRGRGRVGRRAQWWGCRGLGGDGAVSHRRRHFPYSINGNRRLQSGAIEAPSTPAIEGARPPPPRLRPMKALNAPSPFPWIGRLLPSVPKGFLQNRQTNDKVTREEQGLRLD
jgi:hypothetical protein